MTKVRVNRKTQLHNRCAAEPRGNPTPNSLAVTSTLMTLITRARTNLRVFSPQANVVDPGVLGSKVLRDVDREVLNVGKTSNPGKHDTAGITTAWD